MRSGLDEAAVIRDYLVVVDLTVDKTDESNNSLEELLDKMQTELVITIADLNIPQILESLTSAHTEGSLSLITELICSCCRLDAKTHINPTPTEIGLWIIARTNFTTLLTKPHSLGHLAVSRHLEEKAEALNQIINQGNSAITSALIAKGFNPNLTGKDGRDAFVSAAETGNFKMAIAILETGKVNQFNDPAFIKFAVFFLMRGLPMQDLTPEDRRIVVQRTLALALNSNLVNNDARDILQDLKQFTTPESTPTSLLKVFGDKSKMMPLLKIYDASEGEKRSIETSLERLSEELEILKTRLHSSPHPNNTADLPRRIKSLHSFTHASEVASGSAAAGSGETSPTIAPRVVTVDPANIAETTPGKNPAALELIAVRRKKSCCTLL